MNSPLAKNRALSFCYIRQRGQPGMHLATFQYFGRLRISDFESIYSWTSSVVHWSLLLSQQIGNCNLKVKIFVGHIHLQLDAIIRQKTDLNLLRKTDRPTNGPIVNKRLQPKRYATKTCCKTVLMTIGEINSKTTACSQLKECLTMTTYQNGIAGMKGLSQGKYKLITCFASYFSRTLARQIVAH